MSRAATLPGQAPGPSDARPAWPWVLAALAFAALVRWAVLAGFMGSDEVTYLSGAMGVLSGEWPHTDYIGALRYGVNLPVAAFMALFGVSEWSALAWGALASLGELLLVYLIAARLWGARVGLWAMLLLAVMPVHAHFATRLMADPPLSLCLGLAMWCLLRAESPQGRALDYLGAGLALGACYWLKDAGLYVAGLMLVGYGLLNRRFHWRWAWLVLGVLAMVLGNMALMAWAQGDPLHLVHSGRNSVGRIVESTSPWFYLKALFVDLRHVGLLGWLALAGLVQLLRGRTAAATDRLGQRLVLLWALGFVLILSALPIRQNNYILLFAAPLAMLGGLWLASLGRGLACALFALAALVGLLLASLQQASLHAFTANSRAAVQLADAQPQRQIYAPTGAFRADQYARMLGQVNPQRPPLRSLEQLDHDLAAGRVARAWVMRDPQTQGWGAPEDGQWGGREACLNPLSLRVEPQPGRGLGRPVARALLALSGRLPASVAALVQRQLGVQPSRWYEVIPGCRVAPLA
ncbi:glycosyltransferase family 39 protein [Pelomonas sp. CA6]|uniref:ArnT family glycosyltransferase n=1 Tax=Pelomonas sp. CA6 TaxID=2907999 RepID=UPI001F4C43A2|nr:glycosyltransferase family 39 protein [Pelomonas sp. CA6]MCH7344191.1 glycosyltransferase family 39 protein [Pelomonas sp. CA6]